MFGYNFFCVFLKQSCFDILLFVLKEMFWFGLLKKKIFWFWFA
jgi:hypothetical protein